MRRLTTIIVPYLLVLALTLPTGVTAAADTAAAAHTAAPEKCLPTGQIELRNAMRQLWQDHVSWTRLFIVSATGDLPDKQATTERLLRNQQDIGNAIKPYYGTAAGDKLTALLTEHITIAAELVTAAMAEDKAALTDAHTRWLANADAVAAFLAQANPDNWPEAHMRGMLHEHLNLTIAEAQARLQEDWASEISAYEQVNAQALEMADGLSQGIIAQFPEQFN